MSGLGRGVTVVLLGAALAVAAAGTAAAEPSGGADSPSNGTYRAYVEVTGSGVGRGGDLAGPPVSSGGGRVVVPSPCGYEPGGTQQEVEQAYLDANGGDEERAKAALLNDANRMRGTSPYWSLPNSTLKAQLQYENWGQEGVWYDSLCDASIDNAAYQQYVYNTAPPVLVNGGPPPIAPGPPDAGFLHDIAVRAMTLPDPVVQLVNPRTVVRLDTQVWVRPSDVAERYVTASVPGLSVTVTATARNVWFTSTGAPSVSCGLVTARTPACALLYQRSSARAPGQQFAIVGHVDWTAVSTAGIPVPGAQMDSAPQGVTVLEVQTVNGRSRWTG